jgi:TonB family protein
MRRHRVWAALFIALVASALLIRRFSLLQLTPTQLRIASLPHAPVQMNRVTIRCTLGLDVELSNANGQWRAIQDHPPCDVSGIVLQSVEATPAEMTNLNYRPLASFEVSASGIVSKVKLLRSSGSSTLDEKALRQVRSYHYPRHDCGACKMSMAIGVDFQGPVWMREPTVQTVSVAH